MEKENESSQPEPENVDKEKTPEQILLELDRVVMKDFLSSGEGGPLASRLLDPEKTGTDRGHLVKRHNTLEELDAKTEPNIAKRRRKKDR